MRLNHSRRITKQFRGGGESARIFKACSPKKSSKCIVYSPKKMVFFKNFPLKPSLKRETNLERYVAVK